MKYSKIKNISIFVLFIVILIEGCYNKIVIFKIMPSSRPCYLNDGKSILFAPVVKNVQRLILYDRKDKKATWINPPISKIDNCIDPVLSKDGKKIAFVWKSKKKKTSEICIINVDGTGFKQITNANHYSIYPFFSPDGKKIYFSRSLKQKQRTGFWLYSIDIDGTDEKKIFNDVFYYIHNPSFTYDGKYIIFTIDYENNNSSYNLAQKIVKFDLKNVSISNLLSDRALVAISSSDNNRIYYLDSALSINLIDINGENKIHLDSNEKIYWDTYFLSISPDDSKLLYMLTNVIKEYDKVKKTTENIYFDEDVILEAVK